MRDWNEAVVRRMLQLGFSIAPDLMFDPDTEALKEDHPAAQWTFGDGKVELQVAQREEDPENLSWHVEIHLEHGYVRLLRLGSDRYCLIERSLRIDPQ